MTPQRLEEIDLHIERRRESAEPDFIDAIAAELAAEVRRLQRAADFDDNRVIEPEGVSRVTITLLDGSEIVHELSSGAAFRKRERERPAPLEKGGDFLVYREISLRWFGPPRRVTLEEYQMAVLDWRYEK